MNLDFMIIIFFLLSRFFYYHVLYYKYNVHCIYSISNFKFRIANHKRVFNYKKINSYAILNTNCYLYQKEILIVMIKNIFY